MREFMSWSLEFCGLKPPRCFSFCQDGVCLSFRTPSVVLCMQMLWLMWFLCNLNSFAAHSGATVGSDILLTKCVYPIENKSANGYLFSYTSNFSTAGLSTVCINCEVRKKTVYEELLNSKDLSHLL